MSDELKTINIKNSDERTRLALITKQIDTLFSFIPDFEPSVRINIIKNPLFNREIFKQINYDELELKKALLLRRDVLTFNERTKIKKEVDILIKEKDKNDKLLKAFCPLPWNHLSIMTNGETRGCCMQIYGPSYGILGVNVKDVTDINSVRNLPLLKEIRKEMIKGKKPSICKQCWDEEEVGIRSKRKSLNVNRYFPDALSLAKKYTKNDGEIDTDKIPLNYLDLRLGNKCNLACRSCGPTESSLWLKNLQNTTSIPWYGVKEYNLKHTDGKVTLDTDDFSWAYNTNFLNQILDNSKNINRLYFTGGEPTINIPHIEFLEKLVKKDIAKNIYLEYNSNGMGMPDRLLNIWPKFRGTGIGFSIDGLENRFEYLRYPGKWKTFIKTLSKLHKNISNFHNLDVSLAPTVSIYNFIHILDMYKFIFSEGPPWLSKFLSLQMLQGPAYMSWKIMPDSSKEKVRNIYKNWIENIDKIERLNVSTYDKSKFKVNCVQMLNNMLKFLDNEIHDQEELLHTFYIETNKQDKLYNQNFKETFPEIDEVLKLC